MQPKNITFPTDAKLMNRAREKLVKLAKQHGVELRQSYARVGKFALIQHQRYAHAKQFKRANRALRKLKTYLGRVIRDIARKIDGDHGLESSFALLLSLAGGCESRSAGSAAPRSTACMPPKWNASARARPTSLTSSASRSALPPPSSTARAASSSPMCRRCRAIPMTAIRWLSVIPGIEKLVGTTIERLHADAGYRGHNAPPDYKFKIYTSKQKRRVTPAIKREMRRRSAVEPVIGHLKDEHRMGRNYLAHREGDLNNAILAAAGYNFRRLINGSGFCCASS